MKNFLQKIAKKLAKTVLFRLALWISEQRCNHAYVEAGSILSATLPRVAETMARQRAEGGYAHRFSEYKLLELAKHLECINPQTILELGSGSTTSVQAEYAVTHPDATVVSVEQNERFSKKTLERMDSMVRDSVIMCSCPRRVEILDHVEICYYAPDYYKYFPDKVIDLVYVDGPVCKSPTIRDKLMPCIDIIRLLESGFTIGNILFDYRIQTIHYFRRSRFGPLYEAFLHPRAVIPEEDMWPVYETRHHSWLRLRNFGNIQNQRPDEILKTEKR